MKTTIDVLAENDILLKAVEFRAALQLMVACVKTPEAVDAKVEALILERAVDEEPPEVVEPTDEEFIVDKYINNAEHEQGAAESAISKYTENDGAAYAESVFEKFAPKEAKSENTSTIIATAEAVGKTAKRAAEKAGKTAKNKFLSLSMMQQSLALLLVVVVVASVIIGVSIKKKNPDIESNTTSSTSSVESIVSQAPTPVYKLEFQKDVAEVKADDGTVVAATSYEYPVVTLSEKPEAQETINSFFSADKAEVLSEFTDENKNAEFKYAYSTKAYGDFKKNERTVTMQKGRVDEKFINFYKSEYSYLYGNVYGNTEVTAYSFSSQTGKQLTINEVMADVDGYTEYAKNFVCTALEQKQSDGEFSLYSDYAETVSTVILQDGRWYFTDTGITVLINPDEVVFYTYGPQIFEMPYSEINSYLAAEYTK